MSIKPIGQEKTATNAAAQATPADQTAANIDTTLKQILCDVLGIETDAAMALTPQSGLFGHLPELDSMAVAGLLTEIEDRFDIVIDDDDLDGEALETFGGLLGFVETKCAET